MRCAHRAVPLSLGSRTFVRTVAHRLESGYLVLQDFGYVRIAVIRLRAVRNSAEVVALPSKIPLIISWALMRLSAYILTFNV